MRKGHNKHYFGFIPLRQVQILLGFVYSLVPSLFLLGHLLGDIGRVFKLPNN